MARSSVCNFLGATTMKTETESTSLMKTEAERATEVQITKHEFRNLSKEDLWVDWQSTMVEVADEGRRKPIDSLVA